MVIEVTHMNILYKMGDCLYINITNKCPCNCTFCIRHNGDSVLESGSLWFGGDEPEFDDVVSAFSEWDLSQFREAVFCGYGEPTERIDLLCEVCDYIRSISDIKIRLNTNGLSDLINEKATAHMLQGRVDTVSVSLNAPTSEEYLAITKSRFGIESLSAVIAFAKDAQKYVPDVMFTVVDVIGEEKIAESKALCEREGILLRVREYVDQYQE